MAKKFKHHTPEQIKDIQAYSYDVLLKELDTTMGHIDTVKKDLKDNQLLKDLNESIKEHRKKHKKAKALKEAQDDVKVIKEEIDEAIADDIQAKKDVSGSARDKIAASTERMSIILTAMKFKKKK